MSKKLYEENDIQSVANAIREKNGSTATYKVSEMAQAIKDIPSGGSNAVKPYREDTVNNSNLVTTMNLYGYEKIPNNFCYQNTGLTTVKYDAKSLKIGWQSFYSCTSLTNFDMKNVSKVAASGFYNCGLTSIVFDQPVVLEDNAFGINTKLKQVIFNAKASSLSSSSFNGCSSLIDIKVSWSQGEVANAPWGATKATITYNYTGE